MSNPEFDPPLVMVEWEDSHGDGTWQRVDGGLEDKVLICRSVGWVVLEGLNVLVIAPHLSLQEKGVPEQGCGVMSIPKSTIRRRVKLEKVWDRPE